MYTAYIALPAIASGMTVATTLQTQRAMNLQRLAAVSGIGKGHLQGTTPPFYAMEGSLIIVAIAIALIIECQKDFREIAILRGNDWFRQIFEKADEEAQEDGMAIALNKEETLIPDLILHAIWAAILGYLVYCGWMIYHNIVTHLVGESPGIYLFLILLLGWYPILVGLQIRRQQMRFAGFTKTATQTDDITIIEKAS
jgi:hypothetical protein